MCRWSPEYHWAPPEHPRDASHALSATCLRLPIRPVYALGCMAHKRPCLHAHICPPLPVFLSTSLPHTSSRIRLRNRVQTRTRISSPYLPSCSPSHTHTGTHKHTKYAPIRCRRSRRRRRRSRSRVCTDKAHPNPKTQNSRCSYQLAGQEHVEDAADAPYVRLGVVLPCLPGGGSENFGSLLVRARVRLKP